MDLSKLISILSIGFITMSTLLIINLIKVYKQKKRIVSLEKELESN